jgi:O-antigen ligase/tetratricopeptide (TPR) repeat protein
MPFAIICDRLFTGGLVFLILFTPFAIGSVHPPVYSFMEAFIFGLVVVWMAKRALLARKSQPSTQYPIPNTQDRLTPLALPLSLFVALVVFQLVPLPPSVLKIISPQTYEAYTQILPGWPERLPYQDLPPEVRDQRSEVSESSGSGSEVSGRWSSVVGQNPEVDGQISEAKHSEISVAMSDSRPLTSDLRPLVPQTWRPLSFAPFLTWPDLLKFLAFAALFFLVWRYPFEKPFEDFGFRNSDTGFFALSAEQRFLRTIVFATVITGLLVAAVGFAHRFSGDARILWFFEPYDSPGLGSNDIVQRASGPFVNPDHFANYLSLILPLALACALFRTFMVPKAQEYSLKILCGFTTFLLFTAILLSLSRGGGIAALVALVVLVWLAPWGGVARGRRSEVRGQRSAQSAALREQNPKPNTQHRRPDTPSRSKLHAPSSNRARVARLSLITVCVLVIVSLLVVGPGGRESVDERLGDTFGENTGLSGRVGVWKDTLSMVRDFPMIGVGLGSWPEVYIHYRGAPWILYFFREAHNDYVEVLAETGIIGFGLLVWFFGLGGRRLFQALKTSSSKNLPVIAGIVAGIGAMAVHEGLDFNLQIPANAFLFTVLLALGLRMAGSREHGAGSREHGAWSMEHGAGPTPNTQDPIPHTAPSVASRSAAGSLLHAPSSMPFYAGAVVAIGLAACAVLQDQSSYPYNLKEAESLAEAKELVQAHPNHAPYHVALLNFLGEDAPIARQLSELRAALWLEPINPYIRDAYAALLMKLGQEAEGLKIIAQSVADSPSMQTHDYLSDEALPELSESQQAAIEEGFKQALARDYPEALKNFGEFYAKLGRFSDQAKLYEQAANKEADSERKRKLLVEGGIAYLKVAEKQGAGSMEQGARSVQRDDALNAERLFRAAIAIDPTDPKPYQALLTAIVGANQDLDGAKDLISSGIKNGAPALPLYLSLAEAAHKGGDLDESKAALDLAKTEVDKLIKNGENPYTLYIALADGAQRARDRDEENSALLKALDRQPRSTDTLMRLANLNSQQRNFDRAALYLNRIANINPDSPEIFYRIAQAEESRYRFAAAGRAYARAIELAPGNASYLARYEAFRERVAANAPERVPQSAKR